MFKVIQASGEDVKQIAPLFDQYRMFYGQKSDLESAERFLKNLFEAGENVVFLAFEGSNPIGFTQLYKTFSSVTMEPFYILNDLFVASAHRKFGVGKMLLEKAKAFCKANGYKGLALETAVDNPAQKLYERLGWKQDDGFLHYFWNAAQP